MRKVKTAVFAGLLALFSFAPAQAGPVWYNVELVAIGPTFAGDILIRMTDQAGSPAFANKWFTIHPSSPQKEILATALTVFSLDTIALVYADNDPSVGVIYSFTAKK